MPSPRLAVCRRCKKPVIFAVISNQAGRPEKRMPLDPKPDPGGNVAAYQDVSGTLTGRVIGSKTSPPMRHERVYMPHFPTTTCKAPETAAPPDGVTFLEKYRKARAARGKALRQRRGTRPPPAIRPGMIRRGP